MERTEETTGDKASAMPAIDLRQLLRLTDDTGMFQHARYTVPDPHHGYCIDDNARALIAAVLHAQLCGHDEQAVPLERYLAFLMYAFNEQTGRFRNFMSYDRRWLEDEGSQDSQARTLWALGLTVERGPENVRPLARELLLKALPAAETFAFLRSKAFALLGLAAFRQQDQDPAAEALLERLTSDLHTGLKANASADWPWWEDVVTYDNAKLPHALMVGASALGRDAVVADAMESLRWLLDVQRAEAGHLSIIGNDGWLVRGGKRAKFDQQPLEAYALVDACLAAAGVTGEPGWTDETWRCFEWFRGANDLGVMLYDEQTGGCRDGLMPEGANANEGAESSLAYLLSVLLLHGAGRAERGAWSVKHGA